MAIIPVTQRPSISSEEPTPEQQSALDAAIAALNDGVDRAESAADQAEQSAGDAATSAADAAESATSAGDSATSAASSASAAAASATAAQAAQTGAEAAFSAASVAADGAITAKNNAAMSATSADNSADRAAGIAEGIPQTIEDALQAAKESGEFDGPPGPQGIRGPAGADGTDGISPTIVVADITGGHRVTITDADGTQTVDVMDGANGNGIATTAMNADYTLTLTYTDGTSYTTPSIRGATGDTGPTGPTGPQGEPGEDYVLTAQDKADIAGLAAAELEPEITATERVPFVDWPSEEISTGTVSVRQISMLGNTIRQVATGKANSTYRYLLFCKNRINVGTSVDTMIDGVTVDDLFTLPSTNGKYRVKIAVTLVVKDGQSRNFPSFYIARYVDGDTLALARVDTMPASGAALNGVYYYDLDNINDKFAIGIVSRHALTEFTAYINFEAIGIDNPDANRITVTGTTPTITGASGYRYVCGEVETISITPPATGIIDVVFTSGSTAAVLTVPSTIMWPAWFDPDDLEADATYEISIMDGVYGAVMLWT